VADEEELEDGGEDEEEAVVRLVNGLDSFDECFIPAWGVNLQANNGYCQTGSLHFASSMQAWHLNGSALTVTYHVVARVTPSNRGIDKSVTRAGTIPVGSSQVDECSREANVKEDENGG